MLAGQINAVTIKEGERFKYAALNPSLAYQLNESGEGKFPSVVLTPITVTDEEDMLNFYHDLIEHHGFIEVAPNCFEFKVE